MAVKDLDQLSRELWSITDEYVSADDDDSFTLDGHFTLGELKAIVAKIEEHRRA